MSAREVSSLLPQVLWAAGSVERALVQAPEKRVQAKEVLLALVEIAQAIEAPEAPTDRVQVELARAGQAQAVLRVNLVQGIV